MYTAVPCLYRKEYVDTDCK